MREFYLENQNGEKYPFNYSTNTIATDIKGLGFERDLTYLQFENNYQMIKDESPRSKIQMTLIFINGYSGYDRFLQYLKGSTDLKLYYKTDDTKYVNTQISSMTKTELESNTIKSQVTFDKLSMWQKDIIQNINVEVVNNAKTFPFIFPYTFSQSYKGKVKLTNLGTFKAPTRIEIKGAVNNPEIIILQENKDISKLRLNIQSNNCTIIIDSNNSNQIMKKIENGVIYDIYQMQDFNEDNFLYLPVGISELEFKPGVSANTTCKITFTEEYLG